jgi:ATP-binding cassette subfamily F protein 3
MLTLADIAKSYGTRTLFREVSLFVSRTDRYGLVGPNGAGKSTLFRLILGEESPDEGTLTWERGADYGFLPQETAPAGDETILQLALGHTLAHNVDATHDHYYDEREPQAKKILAGLGFRDRDFDRPARI